MRPIKEITEITHGYIPTSRRNYLLNLRISTIMTLLGCFLYYITYSKLDFFFVFFNFCLFLFTFRIVEYLLTKKIIWGALIGPIETNGNARFTFIIYVFAALAILYVESISPLTI